LGKQPTSSRIWYSALGGERPEYPGFYPPSNFEWVEELEKNWEVIAEEVLDFVTNHQDRVKPYFNKTLVNGPKKWKAFAFRFWDLPDKENAKVCPETMRLLKAVPNLLSASVSMLEPGAQIHEHRGDTNAIYRCHLGLVVPAVLPDCGFKVKGEERSWEQGKILVFTDSENHAAWNSTDAVRYVLLFDVLRPEFSDHRKRVCSTVLTGLIRQLWEQKMPWLKRVPRWLRKPGFWMVWLFVRVVLLIKK